MEWKELQKMSQPAWQERLVELRHKVRELRFSLANSQLKNVRELRSIKQEIAQILTLLNAQRKNNEAVKATAVETKPESK